MQKKNITNSSSVCIKHVCNHIILLYTHKHKLHFWQIIAKLVYILEICIRLCSVKIGK